MPYFQVVFKFTPLGDQFMSIIQTAHQQLCFNGRSIANMSQSHIDWPSSLDIGIWQVIYSPGAQIGGGGWILATALQYKYRGHIQQMFDVEGGLGDHMFMSYLLVLPSMWQCFRYDDWACKCSLCNYIPPRTHFRGCGGGQRTTAKSTGVSFN